MDKTTKIKNSAVREGFVYAVSMLYILLFVYAAVSKLTDFQNFRLQIAQSPLLTAYAGFVAVTVLVAEIVIAVMLAVPKLRRIGLDAAFTLMMLFSVYIFLILNYSPYIPCSCGGILEKMDWKQHLVFNLAFVVLAALAQFLNNDIKNRRVALKLGSLSLFSVLLMWGLFLSAENMLHHRNNFVRRIPPFAATESQRINLDYNSYYLAGVGTDKLFLGNITAPSIITTLDTALSQLTTHRIQLDDSNLKFTVPRVKVQPPHFYVYDGTVPCIFSGRITDWKAQPLTRGSQIFTHIAPVDSTGVIFRAATKKYGNLLGKFDTNAGELVTYRHGILQKQVDGFFDTDGSMSYSPESGRFVYLYLYRNQYIVTDKNLNLVHRGNTIDTTTKAKIKIEYLHKTKQRKFSEPPLIVNRKSALHRNLLFVNSTLAGKYDPEYYPRETTS